MLYIQPLFYLGLLIRRSAKSGYADDIYFLAASNSLKDNCITLGKDCQEALNWAHAEGLEFNLVKTELIYFTCY